MEERPHKVTIVQGVAFRPVYVRDHAPSSSGWVINKRGDDAMQKVVALETAGYRGRTGKIDGRLDMFTQPHPSGKTKIVPLLTSRIMV